MADGRTGLVRPERVRVAPAGINGGRPARVVETIYLGQMVRYHLSLAANRACRGGAAVVGKAFAAGDEVAVSWDTADIWPVA